MNTIKSCSIFLLFIYVSFACNTNAKQETREDTKPNIVIILADDLGWDDVGYHGSKIRTPHLDKIANEGVVLDRFYVAPVCTPTRAGLLTGKYPNRFGVREVVIPPWRDFGIDPEEVFLPEELAKAGYKNRAMLGKWHLGHSDKKYYPLNQGFTHFYGHLNGAIDYFTHEREGELDWHNDWESSYDKGYATDLITDHAIECIQDYSKEGPFFLYVAYNAPHIPLQAMDEDLELYGFDKTKSRFGLGEEQGHGNTKAQTYAAMVSCMDQGIGKIRQSLKAAGIEDNTILLFFSDNGADTGHGGGSSAPLREHKFYEFDGGVRVPALINWPAQIDGNHTIDQVTGFVDIMPTLMDALAYDSDVAFDGISMMPVLSGESEKIDRHFYLGLGAVVTNEWKFIEKGHNRRIKSTSDMLFQIDKDPTEASNVINEYVAKAQELRRIAQKYDSIKPPRSIPPFTEGKEGFNAPKEWKVQ